MKYAWQIITGLLTAIWVGCFILIYEYDKELHEYDEAYVALVEEYTELENRYFTNENIEENTYQQQIKTQDEFKVGTLIQNPPFGSQEKGKRNADRNFMKFAVNSAEVIYSFHMANTEEFVIDYYRNLGAEVSHKLVYKFPIPKIYDFHKEESRDVKIVVLRVENFNE